MTTTVIRYDDIRITIDITTTATVSHELAEQLHRDLHESLNRMAKTLFGDSEKPLVATGRAISFDREVDGFWGSVLGRVRS